MESTASGVTRLARLSGSLSLLAAIFACLALWSGIALLLTHPSPTNRYFPGRWPGGREFRRLVARWPICCFSGYL